MHSDGERAVMTVPQEHARQVRGDSMPWYRPAARGGLIVAVAAAAAAAAAAASLSKYAMGRWLG